MSRLLKNRWTWIGIAAVAAIVCAIVFWPKPLPKKSAPLEARVELAAGEVHVVEGKTTERAVSGMALRADSEVRVAPSARALIRLPDGSGAFLRGGSRLVLKQTSAELLEGEYWLDASSAGREPFEHWVAGARIAAVDSGLSLKKTPEGTQIYVARGQVAITSESGRAEVNAGEQALVKGTEAPTVSPVAFWEDWTGGMADAAPNLIDGAGRGMILGVPASGPIGAPALPLDVQRQSVSVVIRDGLSETKVEQTFFNPTEYDVEGWYWFTVPADASVTGFALETDGVLVDGEFVENREARAKYSEAKSDGHSPAILEHIDNRTYRARIFPIRALKTRQVVLRYVQMQPASLGKLSYVYPMSQGEPVKIGEFSLRVDLGSSGKKMRISTLADARIENAGEFVTMRRSGFTPRVDFQLEALVEEEPVPVRLSRYQTSDDSADYVLARYTPDLDWSSVPSTSADVVVVVDTSAAGDDAMRALEVQTAEAILRSLSETDRFALIALDVRPVVLHPENELATASAENVSKALDRLAEHPSGGATDLSALFDVALARLHKSTQPALVYVGDGIATSGELTPERLLERLSRAFSTSSARLFTVGVGSEADFGLLSELARAGGGQSFRVDEAAETTVRALELSSAVKLPTLTELSIDLGAGLDQVFISGGARVAKGSEVSVLARTHHPIPNRVKVRGKLSGKPFEKEYDVKNDGSILASFVPRLWASEYVRSILGSAENPDMERGRVAALGVRYGLLTPYSSILALESEHAYSRMGIQRGASPLRGTRLTALTREEEDRLRNSLSPFAPSVGFGCKNSASESAPVPPPETETRTELAKAAADLDAPSPPAQAAPATAPDGAEQAELAAEIENMKPAMARPEEEAPLPPRPTAAEPPESGLLDEPARPRSGRMGGGLGGSLTKQAYKHRDDDKSRYAAPEDEAKPEAEPEREQAPVVIALGLCSDVASRPLWQRTLLWKKRIRTAGGVSELLERYTSAKRACELADWRAERAFLQLMVPSLNSPYDIRTLLDSFAGRTDVQQYLGKLILRRSVDPAEIAAVEAALFRSPVDWNAIDIQLTEIEDLAERIEALKIAMNRAPDDPNGSLRLIDLLVRAERVSEAVEVGRRVRERGFLTPSTARRLGDLLADAGQQDAATRAYSEIVEFDPNGLASRKLLGDVYLAHGWYDAAYRQYQTLSSQAPDDALGWLRLAGAAAGSGRVDEALRIERQIMNAEGTPGPDDPRRWARLLSAARLARLWQAPESVSGASKAAIERKLKELQLFTAPGALVLLTWEDMSRRMKLEVPGSSSDDIVDAGAVGLYSCLVSLERHPNLVLVGRLHSQPENRGLALERQDLVWDGKKFEIQVRKVSLPRLEESIAL